MYTTNLYAKVKKFYEYVEETIKNITLSFQLIWEIPRLV